jgi:DNA ligase-1
METTSFKIFPTLYALSSTNKVKCWSINLYYNADSKSVVIETKHGYLNGAMTSNFKEISSGKNIGKANETTIVEQANLEALAMWNKKLDKGYLIDNFSNSNPNALVATPLPMLAHDFFKRGKDISYPCFVQPKLNGIRMIAYKQSEDKIIMYSRNGKLFNTLNHLEPELLSLLNVDEYLDGEIYNHSLDLQTIVSILKCEKEDRGRDTLQYHIYDYPNNDKLSFDERYNILKTKAHLILENSELYPHLMVVPSIQANDSNSIAVLHKMFIVQDYEGVMVRNTDGEYSFGHRSANLQKYKHFQNAEFTIVDIVGGEKGKSEENCAIFVCKTEDDKLFNVRPKGTKESRVTMLENKESFIGELLTVKYFDLTPDGIPFHPVGESIRNYE